MSYSYTKKTTQTSKTMSSSQVIEDSKKKPSLLQDNSWIRRTPEEDDPVEIDPNFGKTILSKHKYNEILESAEPEKISSPSASVLALTKRFTASQDDLNKSSTLPASSDLKTTSYTRSTSTSLKSETPKTTTVSRTTVIETPKSSTTTTVTKDGKTTETTVFTSQTVSSSPVIKTPTKTDTFTDRVFSDVKSSSKVTLYSPTETTGVTETTSNTSLYSPTKTVKVTETTSNTSLYSPTKTVTVTTSNADDGKLLDSLKSDVKSALSTTSVTKTETVTVKSSLDGDGIKTTTTKKISSADDPYDALLLNATKSDVPSLPRDDINTFTTTRNYSTTEDELYGTLLPKSMTSTRSSSVSADNVDSTTTHRSYSTRTDYSGADTVDSSITRRSYSTRPDYSADTVDSTITRRSYSTRPDYSYEHSSVTSPTVYTSTTYKDSSADTVDSTTTRRSYSTRTDYSADTLDSTATRRSYSTRPDYSADTVDSTITRRSYSTRPDNSFEHSSVTSPTVYTNTTYKDGRVDDSVSDAIMSKSSIKTVYSSPDNPRTVLEKDLCSYCRKPFNAEAKMILEDMKINCHASCFKCEVCSSTLGNMKAGDSMWIYRRTVHCDRCFESTREKWRQ